MSESFLSSICSRSRYDRVAYLGLWLSRIEQAPPEVSGTVAGNTASECGQIQGSLSLFEAKASNK